MGAVTFSLDIELLSFILRKISVNIFIETGTYLGNTVDSVNHLFEKIISIELSEKYYQEAKKRFSDQSHIQIFQGDSSIVISHLDQEIGFIKQPIVFWLDAHWCESQGTAGQQSQCPLLTELVAIGKLHPHSFILIDDARYFLAAPNKPNEFSQWPYFDIVLSHLRLLSDVHEVMVFNDVIIYYPKVLRTDLLEFTHHKGIDWLSVLDKSRNYNLILEESIKKESMINEIYNEAKNRLQIIDELNLANSNYLEKIEVLNQEIINEKIINNIYLDQIKELKLEKIDLESLNELQRQELLSIQTTKFWIVRSWFLKIKKFCKDYLNFN
jgi:hypothetical protein